VIRFSASLVAIAVGLLIAGLVTSDLKLVYAAIGVSGVALLALVAGAAMKREDLFGDNSQGPVPSPAAPQPAGWERQAGDHSVPAPAAAAAPGVPDTNGWAGAEAGSGFGWSERERWARPAESYSSASPWPVAPSTDIPATADIASPAESGAVTAASSSGTSGPDAGWATERTDQWRDIGTAPWEAAAAATALPQAQQRVEAAPGTRLDAPGAASGVAGSVDTADADQVAQAEDGAGADSEAEVYAVSAADSAVMAGSADEIGSAVAAGSDFTAGSDDEADSAVTADSLVEADSDLAVSGQDIVIDDQPAADQAAAQVAADTGADSTAPDHESLIELDPAAEVTVAPGIPRYHDAHCILIRFMGDDDLERMPLAAAQQAGCTPCRACLAS